MADDIGQLSIGAEIDLDALQESFIRLEGALNNLGGKFDGINADMNRSEESAKSMSFAFLKFTAASAAIYGLAKTSPQLSAALAEMQIGLMEVSFSLGEALEPAANTAAQAMGEFAGWLNDNQDLVNSLGGALNNTLVVAIGLVKTSWETLDDLGIPSAFKWLLENFGPGADFFKGLIEEIPGISVISDIKDLRGTEKSKFETVTNIISDLGPGAGFVGGATKYAAEESIEWLISKLIGKSTDKSQTLNSSDTFI